MPQKMASRRERNPLWVAWLTGLWIAALPNWPLWHALNALPEMTDGRGRAFMLAFAIMVAALNALLMSLFAWRRVIKWVAGVFLLSAALGAYFSGTYGTVIDPSMMHSAVQSNWNETRDLLSWRIALYVIGLGLLPLAWVMRTPLTRLPLTAQLRRNGLSMLAALLGTVLLLLVFFSDMSVTMRNHTAMRYLINPLNSFYAITRMASNNHNRADTSQPMVPVGRDATITYPEDAQRPPLLIVVVGETARAANFSLYGYPRPTNPELQAHQVLAFKNMTSCGTDTATSVPCMFSSLGKEKFLREKRPHEGLLDVIAHTGMAVLWIDNQAGCKGVCDRVPHVQTTDPIVGAPALAPALCDSTGECLDEALLHGLDARLAALPAEQKARGTVLLMHQMGSHGPAYAKRSPPQRKPFVPECATNILRQCETQALINTYDNAIAYTDHILGQAITWLKAQEAHHRTALIYLSDHGESLGEKNLYLHGMPFAVAPQEQTHIPFVLWLSQATQQTQGLHADCLNTQLEKPLSHNHFFHTTLGLLGISTQAYQPNLDALQGCRKK